LRRGILKKIIACILIFILFLQILPIEVFSASTVKTIDVILDDLSLKINGEKFSHKNIFIYNDEIYIPMGDLAKALELKLEFRDSNKTLYLGSNNKLNLKDTSSAYVAYQRGYEINAKNRLIQTIENQIDGKSTKNNKKRDKNSIKVGFGNINIYLDSQKLDIYPEPLSYKDDIYVELGSISRHLLITPNIETYAVNFDTNAVLKKETPFITPSILAEYRDAENTRLTKRLEEMNKRKKIMLDLNLPYMEVNNVSDMESYLNRYFDRIEIGKDNYVEFDIDLSGNSNSSYYLEISLRNRYRNNWYKLEKRQVQAYIWDLYVAITNLLDEEAKVQGAIRNPSRTNRNYVTFDTRYKDLNFNFTNSGLDLSQRVDINFIKDLLYENRRSIYKYDRFKFEARISGYDLEIIIEDIDGLYFERWNLYNRTDFLDSIGRIIHRRYPDLRITGRIFNGNQSSNFVIDEDIHSTDLILELNERLNQYYSSVREDGIKINMNYTVTEENNEIRLMAYADISRSDERWNERILLAINNLVDRALREVLSVFDKDVTVKIFDKDGNSINDYGIFKNAVSSVTASPSGGEILSSQKIELFTDTEGANIYYTTDNTNPTINSTRYTGGFTIGQDTVIKAFAIKAGMKDSSISTFVFKVVSDENMSKGLDDLRITPDALNPSFTRLRKTYTMNLGNNIDSIILTPTASTGIIKIDGIEVKSGESITVQIPENRKEISIAHKEENKSEFIYTITVNKSAASSDVRLEVEDFKTSIVGSFKGYLVSRDVDDFSGYTVILKTKSGPIVKEGKVNSGGGFSIAFDIDIINNIIGYEYEVLDPTGNRVDKGSL
jgi:hypothetical protein